MPTFVTNTDTSSYQKYVVDIALQQKETDPYRRKRKTFRITLVSNIQCRVCQSSWRYPITAAPFSIIIFKKNSFRSSFFLFAYIKVLSLPHTTIIQPYFCRQTNLFFSPTLRLSLTIIFPWQYIINHDCFPLESYLNLLPANHSCPPGIYCQCQIIFKSVLSLPLISSWWRAPRHHAQILWSSGFV